MIHCLGAPVSLAVYVVTIITMGMDLGMDQITTGHHMVTVMVTHILIRMFSNILHILHMDTLIHMDMVKRIIIPTIQGIRHISRTIMVMVHTITLTRGGIVIIKLWQWIIGSNPYAVRPRPVRQPYPGHGLKWW